MRMMTAGGSHLHDAGYHFDRRAPPERKWREPTEWTRTKVRVNRLSYTSSGLTPYVAVNSLLTRLFFTSRGFFLRTRSALRASLRARCSLLTRGRLRTSCSRRTRSALRASLRPRCSLLTRCRLRMSCTLRMGCPILIRAGCGRFILGCPVLIRASCSRLVRSCPILIRASRSCFILGCPILIRAGCSRLVRSCPILIRAGCSRLVRSCPILIRASRSRFILGCPILIRAGCSRFILGCPVRCSRLLGRYHPMTAKLRRLRSCSDCRPSAVHGRQECVVGTGSVHMLGLQRRWRAVLLVCRCLFCPGRAGVNSTGAAVITDMVHSGVVDYGPVVNIVNVPDVHVVHRAVVVEGPVIPISAFIADTTIAEAVVDA